MNPGPGNHRGAVDPRYEDDADWVRSLSRSWFIAVHAPVVLAIAMRLTAGIPFRLVTLPLFVAAFFVGQMAGGLMRMWGAPE